MGKVSRLLVGLGSSFWGQIWVELNFQSYGAHYSTPPLKVGARPRSDSMEIEKNVFICYQGNHHAIDLNGFGWEIIEF